MAPLLFFTPNQRPCVKAIYGPAVHSRHLPHICPDSHAPPPPAIRKMHGKPTTRLLGQPFKKCMARGLGVSWSVHDALGSAIRHAHAKGLRDGEEGLGQPSSNPQVTLKQPSDKSQATLEQTPRRPERFHERFVKGFMKYL